MAKQHLNTPQDVANMVAADTQDLFALVTDKPDVLETKPQTPRQDPAKQPDTIRQEGSHEEDNLSFVTAADIADREHLDSLDEHVEEITGGNIDQHEAEELTEKETGKDIMDIEEQTKEDTLIHQPLSQDVTAKETFTS
jgi:hypothetical protein